MAHVVIKNLAKEFINRRKKHRLGDDTDVGFGDNVLVLDNINLEFFEGEMVCILGPSGCGNRLCCVSLPVLNPFFREKF